MKPLEQLDAIKAELATAGDTGSIQARAEIIAAALAKTLDLISALISPAAPTSA